MPLKIDTLKQNSDPNLSFLIHPPPLESYNDLKNDCIKNLFILFLTMKIWQKHVVIRSFTSAEIIFFKSNFRLNVQKGCQICLIWEILAIFEKQKPDCSELILSLTLPCSRNESQNPVFFLFNNIAFAIALVSNGGGKNTSHRFQI